MINLFRFVVLFAFAVCIFTYATGDSVCPSEEQIYPCTCNKAPDTERVTAICSTFETGEDLRDVFQRNPNWSFQDLNIENCTMPYIPAYIVERAQFQRMNVSWSTLYSLFDVPPKSKELNMYLKSVRFMKDIDWSILSQAHVIELGAFDTIIPKFGRKFKEGVVRDTIRLWFENTSTKRISPGTFANLKELESITIKRNSLKILSRDMFPRPANLYYMDFSYNRIETLPDDIFEDMPTVAVFIIENNLLTTLPETVFGIRSYPFGLWNNPLVCNCEMKWLTTNSNVDLHFFQGTCVAPDSMKGKELQTLKKSDFSYCA